MSGLEEKPRKVMSGLEERQRPVSGSSGTMLIAAMDFGTTYSGYAFKFPLDSPKYIYIKSWNEEAGSSCLPSEKAPSCVLLRANGEFKSFGYKAEKEYNEISSEGQMEEWHFFKHFKMILHNEEVGIGHLIIFEKYFDDEILVLCVILHTFSCRTLVVKQLSKILEDMKCQRNLFSHIVSDL